jgi:toxin ParE1/3/4
MANNLRFSPAVPGELKWAIDSYEAISIQLGNRVRDAIDQLFQRIKETPELYAVVYDNIRIARVRPFPLLVHYRVTHLGPEIVAVFPSAANPDEWKRITRTR